MRKKMNRYLFMVVFMFIVGVIPACDNIDNNKSARNDEESSLRTLISYDLEKRTKKVIDPDLYTSDTAVQKKYVPAYIPEVMDSDSFLNVETRATRSIITSNTSYPYRTFVKLIIYYPNGDVGIGSGTLVGYKHVFTAGHCVFESLNGGCATAIEVIPGKSGPGTSLSEEPYGRAWASSVTAPAGWTVNRNDNYDYGIITLSTEIGRQTGWHGYGYVDNDSAALNLPVTIYGYPANAGGGDYLYGSSDSIRTLNYYMFYTSAIGSGGQSGGALRCNSSGYMIGIYTGGSLVDLGGGQIVSYNRAVRIRKYVFDTINAVKAANGDN